VLVGTDGGPLERAQMGLREILVAPAQRVDVVVHAIGQRMSSSPLLAAPYNRGKMGGAAEDAPVQVLDVIFSAVLTSSRPTLPPILRSWPQSPAAAVQKRVVMSESMSMTNGQQGMQFLMNGKSFAMDRVDLTSEMGVTEEWTIVNDSDMDHPFHIHGTQFLVVEREIDGRVRKEPFRALYDTVNLKSQETVRIRIVQTMKGIRMFHCHLLEHEDLGMMGRLDVI